MKHLIFIVLSSIMSCTNGDLPTGQNAKIWSSSITQLPYLKVEYSNNTCPDAIFDIIIARKLAVSKSSSEIDAITLFNNSKFESFLYHFKNIKSFTFSNNKWKKLSIDFNNFPMLEEVIISNSDIDSLFYDYNTYKHIKRLDVWMCNIREIGHGLEGLTGLQKLRIYHCPGVSITSDFSRLTLLSDLTIAECKLHELPKGIDRCFTLNSVTFFDNYLDTIPETFKNLVNLKYYDFSYNRFREKPFVLEQMDKFVEDGFFYMSETPLKTKELDVVFRGRQTKYQSKLALQHP